MYSPSDDTLLILPVILAGGIGARLAPISTPERPKPFVPLADGESLLTKTVARLRAPGFLPPVLIGRAADRFALPNHAREAGVSPAAILLEASGCNTAAAVALGALWAYHTHGEHIMLAFLPADHLISPADAWRNNVIQAAQAARDSEALCLLTATPRAPDPAFGYVLSEPATARHPWQRVMRFLEKPPEPAEWVARGARWNMGQFIGTAGQFLTALEAYAPATLAAAHAVLSQAQKRWEFMELGAWPTALDALPFDRAVLEHAPGVSIPFRGQWQDLGHLEAWKAFTGLEPEDYARYPTRTDRPWGYFESQVQSDTEVKKRLIIYPDCRLSLQRHHRRDEHWSVLSGIAYVELDDQVKRLEKGDKMKIPAGSWHRLGNHHTDILIIEEVQIGKCDENDIERVEDDYGRS